MHDNNGRAKKKGGGLWKVGWAKAHGCISSSMCTLLLIIIN